MDTSARVLLVQAGRLSDDERALLLDRLYELGAGSVQLLRTETRSGRMASSVLIEVPEREEGRFARSLATEFGISSYHRLETVHSYQPVMVSERPLIVRAGDRTFGLDVEP